MTDTTSAMREALQKYGCHLYSCIIHKNGYGSCDCGLAAALTAPAQADIHATTDDEFRESIETALRRFGGIPALARSEGGAKKIVDVVMAEIKAHSPTTPRVDEKEMP